MSKDMAWYFDILAPEWDNAPSEYETREKLISMMKLMPNSVIADIGCGRGVMFQHLLKTNPAKIIAIDVSGEMIRLAKETFNDDRLEYINGDFFEISLQALDSAIFFNSYPHFLDKERLAIRLAKVVKKDGTVIIAHSLSKAQINGFHTGVSVSKLSVTLDNAEIEAKKFQRHFSLDTYVDNDELYFIKMTRR